MVNLLRAWSSRNLSLGLTTRFNFSSHSICHRHTKPEWAKASILCSNCNKSNDSILQQDDDQSPCRADPVICSLYIQAHVSSTGKGKGKREFV